MPYSDHYILPSLITYFFLLHIKSPLTIPRLTLSTTHSLFIVHFLPFFFAFINLPSLLLSLSQPPTSLFSSLSLCHLLLFILLRMHCSPLIISGHLHLCFSLTSSCSMHLRFYYQFMCKKLKLIFILRYFYVLIGEPFNSRL